MVSEPGDLLKILSYASINYGIEASICESHANDHDISKAFDQVLHNS